MCLGSDSQEQTAPNLISSVELPGQSGYYPACSPEVHPNTEAYVPPLMQAYVQPTVPLGQVLHSDGKLKAPVPEPRPEDYQRRAINQIDSVLASRHHEKWYAYTSHVSPMLPFADELIQSSMRLHCQSSLFSSESLCLVRHSPQGSCCDLWKCHLH